MAKTFKQEEIDKLKAYSNKYGKEATQQFIRDSGKVDQFKTKAQSTIDANTSLSSSVPKNTGDTTTQQTTKGLFKNGVQLTPEQERIEREEKEATQSFSQGVTEGVVGTDTSSTDTVDTTDTSVVTGKPTDTDSVVDGDNFSSGDKGNIFDGLDYNGVVGEIAKGTDLGNSYAKEIETRRRLEGSTGRQDPILKNIGFSTIVEKTGDEDELLISSEATDKIVSGLFNGDFSQDGLAPSQVTNDKRLTDFLKGQGYTQNQINAVILARDVRLREDRIREEGEKFAEIETQRVNALIDAEEKRLQAQVDRNLNLAQRQRSLRGIGLSSATERDLRDIQEAGDALMKTYRDERNQELAITIAEKEGRDGEMIAAMRQGLQETIERKNALILQNADIQSKLVAQGKIDAQASWDTLMTNLEVTDVDKEGIDKNASELTGRLSDKFGNAILVDGQVVPVGGTASNEAAENEAFADGIISGNVNESFVPSDRRGKVISILNQKRAGMGSLSFADSAQAAALSKKHFGNTKDENVGAIEGLLLEGKTPTEISSLLDGAGFSQEYTGAIRKGFENAAVGLNTPGREFAMEVINRRLEDGDEEGAIEMLLKTAIESTGEESKRLAVGRKNLLNNITAISQALDEYLNTPEGKKLGKITGTIEGIGQKLAGVTGDPRLASIMNSIALSVQDYRKSQTGAAFSTAEADEYREIFPGVDKTMDLNAAKIASILDTFTRSTDTFYSTQIGEDSFKKLFPDGISGYLHRGYNLGPEELDYSKITPDMTDEEILQMKISGGVSGGGGDDFDINDIDSVNSYLDSDEETDFNSGDLTSGTKVSKKDIGLGTVTQNYGVKSPLTIDNVLLADGRRGTPGVDIDGRIGDKIPSPINGTIKDIIKSSTGLGNRVIIVDSEGNEHYFNHLDKHLGLKKGQPIKRGQPFATIGNSGSVIAGPGGDGSHLDYRVKSSKGWIDPNQFLIS